MEADGTEEDGNGANGADVGDEPTPPLTSPSTAGPLAEKREDTRRYLAIGLAILLAVVGTLLISLTAAKALTLPEAKDLALAVYSPIVVLAGTALGFYFGVHQDGR
jgi:hypothetical protein